MSREEAKKYSYRVEWDGRDEVYVGYVSEFRGLSAHGGSPEEAFEEIRKVVEYVVEEMKGSGEVVPEPLGERKYSGKLVVRMSSSLHKELAREAAEEGVSLNQWIVGNLGGVRRLKAGVS